MAVTSLWAVRGNLGGVLDYAANPEKTQNPGFEQEGDLAHLIRYAVQQRKTTVREEGVAVKQFVTGIHCDPATARREMAAVKQRFGKEGGIIAYHGYQSFAPGECTPELAHQIGVQLARQLWGGRYQVLVATHLDRENHLHSHFVINTVSFADGKKFHRTGRDYRAMREASDALCREYGLSVLENPQQGRTMQYGEYRAERQGKPTWRSLIRKDVDTALRRSMTERQFFQALQQMGYQVKTGADISVRPRGKERFFRLGRNLGEDYSPAGIRRRLLEQMFPERKSPPRPRKVRCRGRIKPARKVGGFRALYYHYCYLLGIFPHNRNRLPRRVSPELREELLRGERFSQEVRLLSRHKIDTLEQLNAYRGGAEERLEGLLSQHKELYRLVRTVAVQAEPERKDRVKGEISALTGQIQTLRRELRLCEDIAARSEKMKEALTIQGKAEQALKKERPELGERIHS